MARSVAARTASEAEETFLALRRVMAATKHRFHAALREHDLTFPQWVVMKALAREGRLPLRTLAERLETTPANVTGIVDRMERDGLVTRARSNEDRRVTYARLTEKGHALARDIRGEGTRIFEDLFEGWTPRELAHLREALGRVRLRPDDATDF